MRGLGEWKPFEGEAGGQFPITLTWEWQPRIMYKQGKFIVRVFGMIVYVRPTRGDIRRLAAALGVMTKETP